VKASGFLYRIMIEFKKGCAMDKEKMTRIGGLFEELESVCCASSLGSGTEPVWDGAAIGKHRLHRLHKMDLIEKSHGYYFPTRLGSALYSSFCNGDFAKLQDISFDLSEE